MIKLVTTSVLTIWLLTSVGLSMAAPAVVASIAPLHALASAVMAGVGQPTLLMRGSASPHGWAMRPSHAKALNAADLIVWIGPELERALARSSVVIGRPGRQLAVLGLPGIIRLNRREEGHGEHNHEEHTGEFDPHLWLDPRNAKLIVAALAQRLSALDPANADRYQRNAQETDVSLDRLESEIRLALAPLIGSRLVVYHDAFQYLEQFAAMGASIVLTADPEQPRSVGQLSRLTGRLKSASASCLHTEPQFNGRMVKVLAQRYQLRVGVIDPLGADIKPGIDGYQLMMRKLVRSILQCR